MFNFFRKKKKRPFRDEELTPVDLDFLNTLANAFSDRYSFFRKQLELGIIVAKSKKFAYGEGTYFFTLDGEQSRKIKEKGEFDITNILFKNKSGQPEKVHIYVMDGIIYGYQCTTPIENLDLSTINTQEISIIIREDKEEKLVSGYFKGYDEEFLSGLDLNESFKIDLDNVAFYTIKNLQDGNYLAINAKGEVYELVHDPFRVKKIFDSVEEFYRSAK